MRLPRATTSPWPRLLDDYHLLLIRSGATPHAPSLGSARCPTSSFATHPDLAVAAATAAMLVGQQHDRAAPLRAAGRARTRSTARSAVPNLYSDVAITVRARAHGRRRVSDRRCSTAAAPWSSRRKAQTSSSRPRSPAYARALYFAGDLDEAWQAALRVLEHPDAERRAPSHAVARSTLALVAVERGSFAVRPQPRREGEDDRRRDRHQSKLARRERLGGPRRRFGRRRQACGRRARAHLRGALPQRRDRDRLTTRGCSSSSPASVHDADVWTRPKRRCARLRDALAELADAGRIPELADDVSGGARNCEMPGAEAGSCSSRRPRPSSRCSVCSPPTCRSGRSGSVSFSRPTRSGRTSGRSTASSGANARPEAVARATALRPARPRAVTRVILTHPGLNGGPAVPRWAPCPLASIGWSSKGS